MAETAPIWYTLADHLVGSATCSRGEQVADRLCPDCNEPFPETQPLCPHCGRPSLFPNVHAAERAEERKALDDRYCQACNDLSRRGCDAVRQSFETEICLKAVPVISTSFNEFVRIAAADTNPFSTYYQRVKAETLIPNGEKWNVLRNVAEDALFPGYKDKIRFGVLSLDGDGVYNYGECSITLKLHMLTHRTSLFTDNNVVFTIYAQKSAMADAENLERGHRATWDERHKLCVAKLGPQMDANLAPGDFATLLLQQGRTTEDDRFVELHIWGPVTVRSVQSVRVRRLRNRPLQAQLRDTQRLLTRYNIVLEA